LRGEPLPAAALVALEDHGGLNGRMSGVAGKGWN
jgi:hypothetical protein